MCVCVYYKYIYIWLQHLVAYLLWWWNHKIHFLKWEEIRNKATWKKKEETNERTKNSCMHACLPASIVINIPNKSVNGNWMPPPLEQCENVTILNTNHTLEVTHCLSILGGIAYIGVNESIGEKIESEKKWESA